MHKRPLGPAIRPDARRAGAIPLPAASLVVAFAAVLALAGGASRADALSQVIVRSGAVLAIVVAVATRGAPVLRPGLRIATLFLSALVLVMALQLVPLPPGLWASLPGHRNYVVPGLPAPWRPASLTPDLGWNAIAALLPAGAVLMLVAGARGRERELGLQVMLGLTAASAVLGMAQLAGGPDSPLRYYHYTNLGAPTGFFANRNHQAALLSCALPALAVWARIGPPTGAGRRRVFLWGRGATVGIADLLMGVVLIATGSRAGLALGGIGLLVQIALLRGRLVAAVRRLGPRGRWALPVAALAAAVLLVAVLASADRLSSVDRLRQGSELDMRGAWLGPSLAMLWTFFPWGSGFGSFAAVFTRFEPFDQLAFTYANEAHDDLLQVVIEGGAAAVALVVAYAGWWLWSVVRWARARSGRGRDLAILGATVTGMLMVASVLDYPLRTPLLSSLFMLASLWLLGPAPAQPPGTGDESALPAPGNTV